jgi:hypothetical protein
LHQSQKGGRTVLAFCLRYPLATEALFGCVALDWGGDAIAGVYLANCYVIKVGMHLAGPKRVFIFTQLGSLPGSNYLSGVGLWRLRGFGHPGVLHPQNIDPSPREFGLSCWASQWLRAPLTSKQVVDILMAQKPHSQRMFLTFPERWLLLIWSILITP